MVSLEQFIKEKLMTTILQIPLAIQRTIQTALASCIEAKQINDAELTGFFSWLDSSIKPGSSKEVASILPEEVRGRFIAYRNDSLQNLAITTLTEQLNHSDSSIVRNVVEALGKIGQGDEKVITALTKQLNHSNPRVVCLAAEALGKIFIKDEE